MVVVMVDVDVGAPEPRWTQMKSSANLLFNGFGYYSKPGKLEAGRPTNQCNHHSKLGSTTTLT